MSTLRRWVRPLVHNVPFKGPLFHAVRSVWTPPESVYRHLHFRGVVRIPVKETSFLMKHHGHQIENELFWKGIEGGWEPHSLQLWAHLCDMSNIILDIGANTGLFSLVASAVSPDATVIAFEPVRRVYEHLDENRRLNGSPFVAEHLAVSGASGTVHLFDDGQDLPLSASLEQDFPSLSDHAVPVSVQAVAIDDYLQGHPLALNRFPETEGLSQPTPGSDTSVQPLVPDLIKIDVEGHEIAVLDGMSELLANHRPTLLIEVLSRSVADGVQERLGGLGYRFYDVDEDGPLRALDRVEVSSSFNVLACAPTVADSLP